MASGIMKGDLDGRQGSGGNPSHDADLFAFPYDAAAPCVKENRPERQPWGPSPRAGGRKLVPPVFPIAFAIGTNAINPPACGRQLAAQPRAKGQRTRFDAGRRSPGQACLPAGGCISGRLVLHFRLNQDTLAASHSASDAAPERDDAGSRDTGRQRPAGRDSPPSPTSDDGPPMTHAGIGSLLWSSCATHAAAIRPGSFGRHGGRAAGRKRRR